MWNVFELTGVLYEMVPFWAQLLPYTHFWELPLEQCATVLVFSLGASLEQ